MNSKYWRVQAGSMTRGTYAWREWAPSPMAALIQIAEQRTPPRWHRRPGQLFSHSVTRCGVKCRG